MYAIMGGTRAGRLKTFFRLPVIYTNFSPKILNHASYLPFWWDK
jgi:hypothetical protein